jgi:hypothetical protein
MFPPDGSYYSFLKPQQEQAAEAIEALVEKVEPALSPIVAPDRHLNNDGPIALTPGNELQDIGTLTGKMRKV